jgi:hypothetical protein
LQKQLLEKLKPNTPPGLTAVADNALCNYDILADNEASLQDKDIYFQPNLMKSEFPQTEEIDIPPQPTQSIGLLVPGLYVSDTGSQIQFETSACFCSLKQY